MLLHMKGYDLIPPLEMVGPGKTSKPAPKTTWLDPASLNKTKYGRSMV